MIEYILYTLYFLSLLGCYIYGSMMLAVGVSLLLLDKDDYEELRETGENTMFNYISDKLLPYSFAAFLVFGFMVYNL